MRLWLRRTKRRTTSINTTFIYVLNDPRTNQIRYVGKADNPLKRWKRHCKPVTVATHKSCWIESLRVLGLTPELEILEEVPVDQWEEIEREYIRVFRMIGIRLTNIAAGGGGNTMWGQDNPSFGRPCSDECKRKTSEANRGKIRRSGASHHMYGKTTSDKQKKVASLLLKGNKYNVGRKMSDANKAKMSERSKGNKHCLGKHPSLETRAKLSAVHLGSKRPESTKQKMREAWVRRKAGAVCS